MFKINNFTFRLLSLVAGIALLATVFVSSGCRKNTESTAIITVIDSATGAVVPGASVKLYASISKSGYSNIQDTQVTDGGGQATFVFKLQAIFDIDVTKGGITKTKRGIVKLEPGETTEKTVKF